MIALALLALVSLPVHAADLAWFSGADENGAEFRYGDAEKTVTPISFWCTPYVDIVYVGWFFRPTNATEGMEVDVTLEAGGVTIDVSTYGSGFTGDETLFVLEGQILFDARFEEFITSDGEMRVTAEGKTETYPIEGAKEKAGVLLEVCGREG